VWPAREEKVAVAHGAPLARLPDDDVRVRADRDRSLARVHAEQTGGVGRRQRDESLDRQAARRDAFGEQQRQHRVQLGHARTAVLHVQLGIQLQLARPRGVSLPTVSIDPSRGRATALLIGVLAQRRLRDVERPVAAW
jgi:hypothetical protein